MDLVSLIISLISGAIGGNVAGATTPDKSLGTLGNSISGLLGGGLGGFILQALEVMNQVGGQAAQAAPAATGLDFPTILASIGSGGVGGAIVMIIAGLIKNQMKK